MKNAWRSIGSAGALIVLLTVVAYIPALRGGFIWDDDYYVTHNPTLRSVKGLQQIWLKPDATVQYYPLTFTAFWLEYHLWGLDPFGFHLVNVLLHAVNALLFWRLLSRLSVPGAWWAAAVFALHPVHVMSVAWVTELKNVLSGFCYLVALLSYLRFCGLDGDRPVAPAVRRRFYGLAMALYLCALLSKTATSILPVAILLMLWWKRGRVGRNEWLPLLPFFMMGILFGGFTLWLEKYAKGALGPEFTLPVLDRFLVAGRSFWFCLGKLAWPAQLTFFYPRWEIDATNIWSYLFPLSAILLLMTLWWARPRVGRAPLAALVYFTLAFPALVLVQVLYMMRYSFVADHWQYLGSLGVIPLGIGAAVIALKRWTHALRRVGLVMGTAVLAVLGLLTWRQGHIYHDVETLWRDTLAKNPNAWAAHNNLAILLEGRGQVPEAKGHYEQALGLKPDYIEAHNNLGSLLLGLGKVTEAMGHFEEAVRLRPDYVEAHNNLGIALFRLGRVTEAINHYELALRVNPDSAEVHYNLGNALHGVGKTTEAITQYEQALRIKPDYADAHNNLGLALRQVGDIQGAIKHWQEASRLKPDNVGVHNILGNAFMASDRVPEAIAQYEQALRIKPDYADAHNNLGLALARAGKFQEAIGHWERALQLKPDLAEAENNWAAALTRLGRMPEAIAHYEQALQIKPDYAEAHNNLGNALVGLGRVQQGIGHLERALRIKADYPEAHNNLGAALIRLGRVPEAIAHYEQVVRMQPDSAEAHNNLGSALAQDGKVREATEQYEQALRLKPDYAEARNNLAWLLATLAPAEGGDPVRAVTLARQACELTGNWAAPYLDTLAVAYAATGRFAEAIATAQKAMELAQSARRPQLAEEIKARLELYRSGRVYQRSADTTRPGQP